MSAPQRARDALGGVPPEPTAAGLRTQGKDKHYTFNGRTAATHKSDGEAAATRRPAHGQAFPYSFMGFAAGLRRRIMRCRGAFAQFTRLACRSPERDSMTTPVMPGAKCAGSALFPVPLVKSGARTRLPPNGRAVRRAMRRRAIIELANTMILFLNFEEGGRRWGQPPPPASRPTPVQRAVQERLLEAAEAMLCLQVSSAAMRTLALGRGKIARGWEDLDAIQSVINQSDLFGSDYRVSRVVAEAPVAPQDAAEDVQVDRLKLPQEAATVQLEDYLVDEDIRDGYLRPSTLTLADSEPFVGRACNRVRRAEFPKFIRALDERGMLAAVRCALGPHAGFFGIRKSRYPKELGRKPRCVDSAFGDGPEASQCRRAETSTFGRHRAPRLLLHGYRARAGLHLAGVVDGFAAVLLPHEGE